MEVFEVVPGLSIGTRLAETADYDSLGVDVVIDLEDWDWAWVPSVPLGKVFVSFPMEDEDDVDALVPTTATSCPVRGAEHPAFKTCSSRRMGLSTRRRS
jgi:hypothetical protein